MNVRHASYAAVGKQCAKQVVAEELFVMTLADAIHESKIKLRYL